MSASVEFVFDFGSPNGYLAHRAMGALLERCGAELEIVPCLLGGIFIGVLLTWLGIRGRQIWLTVWSAGLIVAAIGTLVWRALGTP